MFKENGLRDAESWKSACLRTRPFFCMNTFRLPLLLDSDGNYVESLGDMLVKSWMMEPCNTKFDSIDFSAKKFDGPCTDVN